jgi:hypothetical protein
MSKAGERLIGAAKEAVLLARQIAEAEARGYRRGVEDAAELLEPFYDAHQVAEAALAFLEQTKAKNSPHPENGTGLKSET